MFKKLIEKHKQKKVEEYINEPRFEIRDLHVGDIVLLKKRETTNGITTSFYKEIKKSVIVHYTGSIRYNHIKSKQILKEVFWAEINDYALTKIKTFREKFAIYMRKKNLTDDSLLSIKQVLQLEDALQTGLIDDLTADEIF